MSSVLLIVFLGLFSASLAFTAEYVPEAYYFIDDQGRESQRVMLAPSPRARRSPDGGSYSGSYASAGSGNIDPNLFGFPQIPGFPFFPVGVHPQTGGQSSASSSSSSSSGGGHGGTIGTASGSAMGSSGGNTDGLSLHSRFGGDEDDKSKPVKGVFSSSSSAVDKDGKVTYHVQTGKF